MNPVEHLRPSRLPAGLLLSAVVLGAATHVLASLGDTGPMAWLMLAMGLSCLSCLVHGRRGASDVVVGRIAGHFMVMSVAMIAVHVAVLLLMGGSHAHHVHGLAGQAPVAVAADLNQHLLEMLATMGVELLCLALGASALRLARRARLPDIGRAVLAAA
ncbi:hypothetical protein RGB72_11545 [Glutamicibacter protophormiae]|uniref:hypothetical protein n=1 Tax=Kocuria salsicia TaxID=664639 RepID=UPI0006D84D6F|nr:hypothetical protein [Kocuria salsicia]WNB88579.1 hypothetical protein RGB72_11545 [Glutamicibacter protophormiae]